MEKALIVFVAQILFNIFKVLEIKYTYQNRVSALLFNSIWLNAIALVGTFYSIKDLLAGNFVIVIFFIGGSVLGKWIGMKIDNTRTTIWETLFKSNKKND